MASASSTKRVSKELLKEPKGPSVPLIKEPPKTLKTFHVDATNSVLSQVKSFLPSLAQANVELHQTIQTHGEEYVHIECVQDNESITKTTHCIEMDLALVQYDGDSSSEEDDTLSDNEEREHTTTTHKQHQSSLKKHVQIEEIKS